MTHEQDKPHLPPYALYVKIWVALVVLTVMTVSVSYLDMQKFTVFTALLIATVKATLVLLYFMHVRFEKPIFIYMIVAVLLVYAVFVFLTFSDYAFR
jgi:cytochrome c oxidase subunit 4